MFNNNYVGFLSIVITFACAFLFFKLWNRKIWSNTKASTFLVPTFQNRQKTQLTFLVLLFALLFYLDFLRDYVFTNLSFRMNFVNIIENGGSLDKYLDPTDSLMVTVFGKFTSIQLYYFKIFFTIVFLLFYFLICQLILKIAYLKHRTLKFTLLLYGTGYLLMMLVFSFFFFTFPYEIKNSFYIISMEIGHFLESSLPTLLLLLSFKIYLSSQNINQIE